MRYMKLKKIETQDKNLENDKLENMRYIEKQALKELGNNIINEENFSLRPTSMTGKFGEYIFSKDGITVMTYNDKLTKDKIAEETEVLKIWEEAYINV